MLLHTYICTYGYANVLSSKIQITRLRDSETKRHETRNRKKARHSAFKRMRAKRLKIEDGLEWGGAVVQVQRQQRRRQRRVTSKSGLNSLKHISSEALAFTFLCLLAVAGFLLYTYFSCNFSFLTILRAQMEYRNNTRVRACLVFSAVSSVVAALRVN